MSNDIKLKINNDLNNYLTGEKLKHTLNVVEEARKLAKANKISEDKAETAALLHDMFRDVDNKELNVLIDKYGIDPKYYDNNALAHGRIAAEYANKKYGMEDDEILNAVKYHTTGRKNMEVLEKIIFLADKIEKDRDYNGVDYIRKESEKGLDNGVMASLKNTINHLKEYNRDIDSDTIEALADIESLIRNVI